jgi:voltage-gated potassium channel
VTSRPSIRRRVFTALEANEKDVGVERFINLALMTLILINVLCVILETIPHIEESYRLAFDVIEAFSIGTFTLEYLLRVWSCVEEPRYSDPIAGRVRFALSFIALVDLVAVVPAYLPGDAFLDLRYARVVRLMRMLRLVKLRRYSRTIQTFGRVLAAKRTDLGLIALVMVLLLVLASSSMYFAEHHAQPEVFSSIPASMWWAIQTLTTVGYGDMVPVTPIGKLMGACIALIGVGFFALPAGVLAAAFAEEVATERIGADPARCPRCGQTVQVSADEVSRLEQAR